MSRDWSDSDAETDAAQPTNSAKKPKAKAKAKPKITIEEAAATIPPAAIQYIREKFKTDIHHLRAYDPSRNVKIAVVNTARITDTIEEEDLSVSESE
jgi:hypothetical protein